jgi:hypothetical protein
MSSYEVISATSQALRRLLYERFSDDQAIAGLVPGPESIVFTNPTLTVRRGQGALSLWLYRVTENEFMVNDPPEPAGPGELRRAPLVLNLHYLVTPLTAQADDARDVVNDHLLLGKTMQTLHDNGIVPLRDPGRELAEELRILLSRVSLEEVSRIWEALMEPYRLSVCYEVRVMRIASTVVEGVTRIEGRDTRFSDDPAAVAAMVP